MDDGTAEGHPDQVEDRRHQGAARDSLRSLGLRRIGDVVVKADRPEFRGMIATVRHLVTVEEVD